MEKYTFESFIKQCCKADEYELRKFLKRILSKNGFSIKEDNYSSRRGGKFSQIPNLLAVRGTPKICLVAHTDVCRDHSMRWRSEEYRYTVEPVIKEVEICGKKTRIIQDRTCSTQVGGDDRLGVAINVWIALNTGYDLALLFTTDEEIGLLSADEVSFDELKEYDLLVQVDRGNHSNQLVNQIGGTELCSTETALKLLEIADKIGMPRKTVYGMATDVLSIKANGACKEAVNMTCGYHNSIGADADEYIDIQEAKDTMKYVANIIKFYDLEDILDEYKITFEDNTLEKAIMDDKIYGRSRYNRYYDPDEDSDEFDKELVNKYFGFMG